MKTLIVIMLLVFAAPLWMRGQDTDPWNTAGSICGGDSPITIFSGDGGCVIAPSTPSLVQANQIGIEPVPEPSTLAFGGLALGVLLSNSTVRKLSRMVNKMANNRNGNGG